MNKIQEMVRPNIRQLVPYASARSEYSGTKGIFLDANENSGSPLQKSLNRYPDPLQADLRAVIATYRQVPAACIFTGNGSDEAIDLLFRIFCEPARDNVIVCPPTYGMYEVSAAINNIAVKKISLMAGFQPDAGAILQAIDEYTRLIFICSPNNPTGNDICRGTIEYLLENFSGLVVVDEAYIDFSDQPSFLAQLSRYPNLVVLQTLSKAWGLAGIRLGMAFAHENIIQWLNRVKPPYNLGSPVQEMAREALAQRSFLEQSVALVKTERIRLAAALGHLPFVKKVYPSAANFLLVQVHDAAQTYAYLLEQGIVVRNRSNITLCQDCLRITIGSENENNTLIRTLKLFDA